MSRNFARLADFFHERFEFDEFALSKNANVSILFQERRRDAILSEFFEFCVKNFDMSQTICLSRAGYDECFEYWTEGSFGAKCHSSFLSSTNAQTVETVVKAGTQPANRPRHTQVLEAKFESFAQNRIPLGQISKRTIETVISNHRSKHMYKADVNCDGAIDYQEFVAWLFK